MGLDDGRGGSTLARMLEWAAKLRGKFVVFEGADGSGKTTQYKRLAEAMRGAGLTVCEVREPGGTSVGEQIRAVLLHPTSEMTLRCEMLMYMASRAQLVETVVLPAVARGEVVLADRFVASTYAYQGAGGGLPAEEIRMVAEVATLRKEPDLVLLYDIDQETAAKRTRGVQKVGKKKVAGGTTLFDDRIEQRGDEYQMRVQAGYRKLAEERPKQFLKVDARKDVEAVWVETLEKLEERVGSW